MRRMTRGVARPTSTLTMLVGLVLLLTTFYAGCDARRMYINQRHDSLKEVTPSEPIDVGGWRPVIDSRYDATRPQLPEGYDPMSPLTSGPSGPGDQTADLIPPPRGSNKPLKKIKPTRKPTLKTPELSESRATPPTYALSETRPTMRFPDEKRRNPIRRQRPSHPHHVHYHVRQQPAFSVAESNQQLRFRPSPQAPAAYENPFPGWLLQPQQQEEQQQQQQQVYYNSDNSGLLQLQQQFNSDSQIQLALQQQQPDLAQQQYSHQHQHQEIAPQSSYQHSQATHGAFLPGSTQVFGNANLFNIQNDKEHRPHDSLFLIPSPTEPSVHENEVPQGPSLFQGHTTRGRPVRPTFDIPTDIPKYHIPDISYQQQENSDLRPRRPRPPTGIQAQLEINNNNNNNNNRRPIVNENEGTLRITEVRPSQQPPRHPRPPSTEPPSWSHPVQEVESTVRPRRPRPTPQTQFLSEDSTSNDTPVLRRPRPPMQDQIRENDNHEKQRVRRPRPPVQEQPWRPSNDEPEEVAPTQTTQFETQVKPQRPRQPPPVLEQIEDDIDRPVFTLRPRRPQPVTEEAKTEEGEVQRVRRPRPPVEEEEGTVSEIKKTEEQNTQEDVDETVNVRPRRPRPPPESEDRPVRTRRPRPPQEGLRRRRPTTARPEIEEEAPAEHQPVRRRRPQRPVAEDTEEPERKQHRRPARPWNQRVQNQQKQTPEETTEVAVAVEPETKYAESIPEESAPQDVMIPEESGPEESLPEDNYPAFLPVSYDNFPEYPSLEVQAETTEEPTTTSQAPSLPTFPPKRRRPAYKFEESEPIDEINSADNYPSQFKATTEAATTQPPQTTTLPPTTTYSVINSRLRARLNATRQRYGGANRLTALTSKRNKNDETTTEASPSAPEENNSSRVRQKNRESSRFKVGSTSTTEEPSVERTTFKPAVSRFPRPGNRYYSRYRAGNEEQTETTTPQQDATRRTNVNIYSAGKERRKYPLKTSNNEESVTEIMSKEPTTASYLIAEYTTNMPDITTIPPTENEIFVKSEETVEEKTEEPTTYEPDLEPESTTIPADFSPAKRVTDLTSSATAFKPLSFFSAVPADGKHASQLSSRFTMATEDPILPLEAFFPTFTSKPRQQEDDK